MARTKNILEAFEHIVELAKDSKLDSDFQAKVKADLSYASRKLHLTAMQTILLALFIDRSEDCHIRISEIAEYTGCRTTKILRLADDVDVLEKLHYLRASRSHDSLSYRVPGKVLNALRKNIPYEHVHEPIEDLQSFFDLFGRLAKEKDDDELTYESLKEQTLEALEEIKETHYAKELKRMHIDEDEIILFTFMAHIYVDDDDDSINFYQIDDLYDNNEIPSWCKRRLRNRTSPLFEKGLIENANDDGMARRDAFCLTLKAKEELLADLNIEGMAKVEKGLIKPDTLAEKHLFYNASEKNQIKELSSILSANRFNDVQSRLRKAGMRHGFCCIFYGAPGTGKTETVYQLARKTGRAIMRVDVDKIKSCWVGESEKNIKALFDRYRRICKDSSLVPILLFNEADAVLGVRLEGASSAVDKMENSIQNIILQEMETLEGIMIATTNLTTNLDKAFERRFLYKIRFDKPTVAARSEIWKTMLPGLTASDANTLASQFDLSGGEIENIARKHAVNAILSGNDNIDLMAIIDTCRHERLNNTTRTRIGF